MFYGLQGDCCHMEVSFRKVGVNLFLNHFQAHVEIVTGWKLGEGPCGRNCSLSDVGKLTNDWRVQADHIKGTSGFFGNFSTYNTESGYRDIISIVRSNFSEHVISVNVKRQWEQESLKFSLEMESISQDIKYGLYFMYLFFPYRYRILKRVFLTCERKPRLPIC